VSVQIRVRRTIQHWNYSEGERPPLGPPYRIQAKNEHGEIMTLTTRPDAKEARKVARAIRDLLG
jgi:hypothetical protein